MKVSLDLFYIQSPFPVFKGQIWRDLISHLNKWAAADKEYNSSQDALQTKKEKFVNSKLIQ